MDEAAKTPPPLPDDPVALKALIGEKLELISQQETRIKVLEEQLALLRHKQFAARSEKASPDQISLFNEAEVSAEAPPAAEDAGDEIVVPEHKRKKTGRKPIPDNLPRVRVEHDISEADKLCPCGSGEQRPRIGEEITEQYDIIPAKMQVLQHVRFKYGPCACCQGVFPDGKAWEHRAPESAKTGGEISESKDAGPVSESQVASEVGNQTARAVVVAPLPAQPIPKSNASPGLAAYIAVSKFVDGLPLYRLETMFERIGVDLPRGTMASWMIRVSELIVPLINLLNDTQFDYDVLQMDETTVQVLKEDGRPAQSKSQMWVRRGGPPDKPVILFDYDPSRSGAVPFRLLSD
jgi:transposase